ncbi:26724_t:CDS:2, partial [Racocetra persica]
TQNKEVQELFQFVNPSLKLSRRHALDSVGPILTFDSWTNVINQNIMGSVFITSKGE